MQYLKQVDPVTSSLFSEIEKLVHLVLSMPISAASAERSFSNLRRLKAWLRTTMTQKRLTHLALLTIHKDLLEKLDMNAIISNFIQKTPERVAVFGRQICYKVNCEQNILICLFH